MWTASQYRQLVRASGWYDLIVTIAFVTPWSFVALHGLLLSLAQTSGGADDKCVFCRHDGLP